MGIGKEVVQRMSLRRLNGVAQSIAHKFSVCANHFAWLALCGQAARVEIDLLALSIRPAEFEIQRNLKVVRMCLNTLTRALRSFPRLTVTRAVVRMEVDVSAILTGEHGETLVPVVYTATLSSDTGKQWKGIVTANTLAQR